MSCGCNKTSKSSSVIVTEEDSNVLTTSTETSSCTSTTVAATGALNTYPVSVTALLAFNMPACGETADISVDDSGRYPAGAVLWNSAIGQLLIVSAPTSTTLQIKNECLGCNVKDPGDAVAVGTVFAIGVPSCAGAGNTTVPSSTTPFLDADFTTPAQSVLDGFPAKVTNVFGLSIGDTVSVASKEFQIISIPDGTTIYLANKGEGGDANASIEWDPNSDGSPDYPIIRIGGPNPCSSAAVTEVARLIGCDGSDQQVGMIGEVTGQVPSWIAGANGDGEWGLKVVNDLALCVTIGCCLILDPDKDPTETYLIEVSDSTGLEADLAEVAPNPLRVTIGGDSFCLTSVVDETHVRVRPSDTVEEVFEYEEGAALCVDDCCNQCVPYVTTFSKFPTGESPTEIIATEDPITITVAGGVSVHTVPVGIGSAGDGSTEAGVWTIDLSDEEVCGCQKYVKIESNFECALPLPAGIKANVEFRITKQLPLYDTFAGAAMPMAASNGLLAGLNDSPNLLQGGDPGNLKTLNTFKGQIGDRDFKDAALASRYRGHIRIVFDNSGGSTDVTFGYSWRVWAELWNNGLAVGSISIP